MDPPNFWGTTMIDIDIDTGNNASNNMPTWLRDMLDRALNATGIRSKKKVASEEAIESLQDVDLDSIESKDCPICYDSYDSDVHKTTSKAGDMSKKEGDGSYAENDRRKRHLFEQDMIIDGLNKSNIPLLSAKESSQFKDPSFFFPVDQAGSNYSRFPQRNLHTLERPTKEDLLPGYNEIMMERARKEEDSVQNAGHVPVKMPNCDHVFGKSCIIEWLKNNVSCPLCRKEVEELKEKDPKQVKLEKIKRNIMNNFNDEDENLEHLMNHSTDVFNPFRRPFNPSITPLTDSSMNQSFASPTYTLPGNSWEPVGVPEPALVLPGKFPIPDFHNSIPLGASRSYSVRSERPRRFSERANQESNNTTNNNDTNLSNNPDINGHHTRRLNTRRNSTSSSSSDFMSSDGSTSPSEGAHYFTVNRGAESTSSGDTNGFSTVNGSDDTTNNTRANRNTWVWSTSFGRGGPERSRRNANNNGRQHPYSRPEE